MPGAPPRKSTARPESSASAGRPDSRAALRALRMAFSINDRPVSSGSTMENSPTERTRTLLPSMACSSLSLPALWLASTSSLKCIMDSGPSFVWEDFLVEIEAVRHAIGSMHIDGETQHLALGEVELRQVIDGLTFGDLLKVSGWLRPTRSFTSPLTLALLALPALSTEIFTTPCVLLRTRPLAAAISGCKKPELKAM